MTDFRWIGLITLLLFSAACLKTRKQANEENRIMQQQVVKQQEQVASQQTSLTEIQEQMRELNGRLQELENKRSIEEANRQSMRETESEKLKNLEDRIKLHEEALTTMEKNMQNLAAEISSLRSAKASPPAEKKSRGIFADAEGQFTKKDWAQAILSYEKYRKRYPKGRRYAIATYKIGVCFEELKQKQEAKAFYQEVLAKYPKSPVAKKARFRLKKIK